MFLTEEANGKYYVVPAAETVEKNFNRFDLPYDSGWEIYRLFNFTGRDFVNYVIKKFNAKVNLKTTFPFVEIYFEDYYEAKAFQTEVEKRVGALAT